MLRLAYRMLAGDRAKFAGRIFGIAFASFLVTFATGFFCGFITCGFALVTENPQAQVWVMDPSVETVEPATNLPDSALQRVRSVSGVRLAAPLAVGTAELRFPNGAFQSVQVIGVDDATLAGAPDLGEASALVALRGPDSAIFAEGGTDEKLMTPVRAADRWPLEGVRMGVPVRLLAAGDEVEVNDHRVAVAGVARVSPRFPPRPLLYTSLTNASRILLPERRRITFVLVTVEPGTAPLDVAHRIEAQTGLRARTSEQFERDTVLWTLVNSEDVGDVTTMLVLAITVGFGVTCVMLTMFTRENLPQYAVLTAMGATPRLLVVMLLAQTGACALMGTGIGLGVCAIAGTIAHAAAEFPFRMMVYAPVAGVVAVGSIATISALVSARPVLKLDPGVVFAGR